MDNNQFRVQRKAEEVKVEAHEIGTSGSGQVYQVGAKQMNLWRFFQSSFWCPGKEKGWEGKEEIS